MSKANTAVRLMEERDLGEADRVTRLAFGKFLGLPDPMAFMGDAKSIHTRWKADPKAAVVAEADGELVGSCFAIHWGSVGFFGPLTVRPDYWDKGVARRAIGKGFRPHVNGVIMQRDNKTGYRRQGVHVLDDWR